jgi:hypothetical protein
MDLAIIGLDALREVLPKLDAQLGELRGAIAEQASDAETHVEPLATQAAVHLHNAVLAIDHLNNALGDRRQQESAGA